MKKFRKEMSENKEIIKWFKDDKIHNEIYSRNQEIEHIIQWKNWIEKKNKSK